MADEERNDPDDELARMFREFLSGNADIDPAKLASAAGLPSDPEVLARMMQQLQGALRSSGDGINWDLAKQQATQLSSRSAVPTLPAERSSLEQAFHVAELWLDEATSLSPLASTPRLMSRTEWATATMPVWTQLAEPVASSIANALTEVLREQAPEEMAGLMQNAGQLMRNLGGTLFAMQLGQVVGQLSTEVVSGGDIGIPLLGEEAALIAQNVDAFGRGLDIPSDQVQLYLAVRELAHARLFRQAKWLRLHVLTSITEFARGIRVDTDKLEQLAADFDPSNAEALRDAVTSGALIPPKSEEQLAALARLESMLALIEGWVDVVTAKATLRLPRADAIAESVRRRRASGGPAESAFATLVGLELRPRRLREAAAMWRAVTDAAGADARDTLWAHPDVMPTAADIDDPSALVARLTSTEREEDDIDRAIDDLLNDDSGDRPREG
jgi:putative hydrolase